MLAGRYQFVEEGVLDPSGDLPLIASSDVAAGEEIRPG